MTITISGTLNYREVPKELKKVSGRARLAFEAEDIFGWLQIENGYVQGGFTIRATRNKLSTKKEKAEYDECVDITSYESY